MKVFPDFLPAEFGLLLLALALIAVIAPYAAGHDYGKIKIPEFSAPAQRRLKWGGPLLLFLIVLLHMPLIPKRCEEAIYEVVTDKELCGTTMEEYVITPAAPKSCRNSAFGREGWRFTKEASGSSGWMGGGQSQNDWCNRLIGSFISSRNIGQEHEASVVRSGESARWTGPFNRTREYNYSCTIKVSWEPIYREQTSAKVCGETPAVMGRREVPATCKKKVGVKVVECDA